MLYVNWYAETINSGYFSQLINNGDHSIMCMVNFNSRDTASQVATIRAPSHMPLKVEMLAIADSSAIFTWEGISSDADGYVITATGFNGSVKIHKTTAQIHLGTADTGQITGLRQNLLYLVTVRAYQDILGPASRPVTLYIKGTLSTVNWTIIDSTQYQVNCYTRFIRNVYWIVGSTFMMSESHTVTTNGVYNHVLKAGHVSEATTVTCIGIYNGKEFAKTLLLQSKNDHLV
jgi:hypothetical protein